MSRAPRSYRPSAAHDPAPAASTATSSPIRTAAGVPVQCLRNEYLGLYGLAQTYSHRYRLHGTLCLWTWLERDR
jgi:hypothetical protein